MKWFGRLFCLVVAVGGFAAAHLLAQEGNAAVPVPTVSVTVPTHARPDGDDADPAGAVRRRRRRCPRRRHRPCRYPPPSTTAPPPVRLPPVETRPPVTTRPAPTPRPARPTTSTTITVPSQPPARGTSPPPSSSYTPSPASTSSGAQSPSASSSARPSATARPQTEDVRGESPAVAEPRQRPARLRAAEGGPAVRGRPRPGSLVPDRRVHPGAWAQGCQHRLLRRPGARTPPRAGRLPALALDEPPPRSGRGDGVRPRRLAPPLGSTARAGARSPPAATSQARPRPTRSSGRCSPEAQPKTSKPRPTASLAGTAVAKPDGRRERRRRLGPARVGCARRGHGRRRRAAVRRDRRLDDRRGAPADDARARDPVPARQLEPVGRSHGPLLAPR